MLVALRRRHPLVVVGGKDPRGPIHFCRACRARWQSRPTPPASWRSRQRRAAVRLALGRIRAVAFEAIVRQDRNHVAIEIDRLGVAGVVRRRGVRENSIRFASANNPATTRQRSNVSSARIAWWDGRGGQSEDRGGPEPAALARDNVRQAYAKYNSQSISPQQILNSPGGCRCGDAWSACAVLKLGLSWIVSTRRVASDRARPGCAVRRFVAAHPSD